MMYLKNIHHLPKHPGRSETFEKTSSLKLWRLTQFRIVYKVTLIVPFVLGVIRCYEIKVKLKL